VAQKESSYRTYWEWRETQPDGGAVYDPNFTVPFTEAERAEYEAYYRAQGISEGLSGAELDAYVAAAIATVQTARTTQYQTMHAQWVEYFADRGLAFPASYDPDPAFVYVLSTAEDQYFNRNVRVWTEEELRGLMAYGLLKSVTDTVFTVENPNIQASDILIVTSSGSIGRTSGQTNIVVAPGRQFTEEERVSRARRSPRRCRSTRPPARSPSRIRWPPGRVSRTA
jgi:hypothetical protein